MIECPGWAAKKVNSQAQKGGMIGIESHICREPRPARGRSPFRGQRSRGVHFDVKGREANRSIVRGEKRERMSGGAAEAQKRRVGMRWKGAVFCRFHRDSVRINLRGTSARNQAADLPKLIETR
jgi:hypothetical protein